MVLWFGLGKRMERIEGKLDKLLDDTTYSDPEADETPDYDTELERLGLRILKSDNPGEIRRLRALLDEKTEVSRRFKLKAYNEQRRQMEAEPEKKVTLAELAGKTDIIKGIWDGLPDIAKAYINNKAKDYTGGKTVSELLENSDALQSVLRGAAGAVMSAKPTQGTQNNTQTPKQSGYLSVELPYNPNIAPQG